MDSMEAFPDGEWESLRRLFSTEEADFAAQFLGHSHFPNGHDHGLSFGIQSSFWPTHEANTDVARLDESLFYLSHTTNSDLNYFSQECSYSGGCGTGVLLPSSSYDNYYFNDSNHNLITNTITSTAMDICMADEKDTSSFVPVFPDSASEETVLVGENISNGKLGNLDDGQIAGIAVPENELQLKRKSDVPERLRGGEEKINSDLSETAKKKPRVSRDVCGSKKNVKSRRGLKPTPNGNNEEDTNAVSEGQSSSSISSEDDSNASQELNGGTTSESKGSAALNSNGKTRASRGSATDPQSLYARKRRERINERLRILQNLVPNGTKVDISTMLEEAVHYVKFLQLQIKLLSSDDMWMYAPIAYNGMDIGLQNLHQKIPSLR